MSKKPVLVIMAAGMGSRYGGLKPVSYTHLTGGQRKAVYDSRNAVIGDGGSGISSMDRRKPAGA